MLNCSLNSWIFHVSILSEQNENVTTEKIKLNIYLHQTNFNQRVVMKLLMKISVQKFDVTMATYYRLHYGRILLFFTMTRYYRCYNNTILLILPWQHVTVHTITTYCRLCLDNIYNRFDYAKIYYVITTHVLPGGVHSKTTIYIWCYYLLLQRMCRLVTSIAKTKTIYTLLLTI